MKRRTTIIATRDTDSAPCARRRVWKSRTWNQQVDLFCFLVAWLQLGADVYRRQPAVIAVAGLAVELRLSRQGVRPGGPVVWNGRAVSLRSCFGSTQIPKRSLIVSQRLTRVACRSLFSSRPDRRCWGSRCTSPSGTSERRARFRRLDVRDHARRSAGASHCFDTVSIRDEVRSRISPAAALRHCPLSPRRGIGVIADEQTASHKCAGRMHFALRLLRNWSRAPTLSNRRAGFRD